MLVSFPVSVFVGMLLGYLAGLGVGGGSLLILWLTLVLHVPSQTAQMINLLFFITAAGSVSAIRLRQGQLRIKIILPAILAGCAASAVISLFRQQFAATWLQKAFGILLLFTGIRELLYRPRNAK